MVELCISPAVGISYSDIDSLSRFEIHRSSSHVVSTMSMIESGRGIYDSGIVAKNILDPFKYNFDLGVVEGFGRADLGFETASKSVGGLSDFETAKISSPVTHESFRIEESWIGKVLSIDRENNLFEASLSSEGSPDEVGDFTISEISPDDFELLHVGAVFYWSVGQAVNKSGRISNESTIRFRRLQHWSRKTLERSKKEAEKFSSWFTE